MCVYVCVCEHVCVYVCICITIVCVYICVLCVVCVEETDKYNRERNVTL